MVDFTRRGFLTQMSVATGVGIAGGLGLHKLLPSGIPAVHSGQSQAELPKGAQPPVQPNLTLGSVALAGPMLIHVRDVPSGEVSMMVGTRELVYRDPDLVSRLIDKARSVEG